ncbi:Dehydrosqualene desaturase [Paraliobacillus sp. PM-2]|uniref:phytoene desaturase family protein n=1 Tax=Paraliobacillus sp. PM-2 TaxID=1462524 RepID=UPI00061C8AD6|nr:phytoene desaturase family protein [Paraliobacillus sp. PM-2]CQR48392.1 Dehydrosqualene desaturase [Paraliobacillus sp. PM-2]
MRTAIIGAGIGGLTAALLLNKQGHQVSIYEKENYLGGRLTFESNGEYRIDQGPTIVLLPELLIDILEEAGVSKDKLHLIPCDPLYDIHYADGTIYRKWRDDKRQQEEIEKTFPGESFGYKRYMHQMKKVYDFGTDAFLSKIFINKRDFLSLQNIKFVLSSQSYQYVSNYLSTFFKDQRLKHGYALQTLYIGGAPHQVPALYGLISYSEHAYGIWYLKGGYASLVPILESICKIRGIKIYREHPVDQIVIDSKTETVTGITVKGDFKPFYYVVFNGDYPTIDYLLPEKYQMKKRLTPSSGCVLVYLGVTERYSESLTHQFFLSEDFDHFMKQVVNGEAIPSDPSCYVFNPVAIDPDAAPEGKSVLYMLIPVPASINPSEEELNKLVDSQIDRIEKKSFKGLRQAIEWQSIRTPREAELDGLYLGGSFGVAPNMAQSGGFRPQIIHSKINGLFAVGASVHPGGGVPIVMQGARLLAQYFKEEGKKTC